MKEKTTIIIIVIAIAAATGGFTAGIKYQQIRRSSDFAQRGTNQFRNVQGGGMMRNGGGRGMRPVAGEVIKADSASVTVKFPDGSTKIVLLSSGTSINKAEQVNATELKTGIQVAVFGTENADGSVTAQNIQINPRFTSTITTPTPGK